MKRDRYYLNWLLILGSLSAVTLWIVPLALFLIGCLLFIPTIGQSLKLIDLARTLMTDWGGFMDRTNAELKNVEEAELKEKGKGE